MSQQFGLGFNHLRKLLGQFKDDGKKHIAALNEVTSANDRDAFMKIVHSFKGSAAMAGVSSIAQICADVESRSRQGLDRSGMEDFARRLPDVFQHACRELEAYLEQPRH